MLILSQTGGGGNVEVLGLSPDIVAKDRIVTVLLNGDIVVSVTGTAVLDQYPDLPKEASITDLGISLGDKALYNFGYNSITRKHEVSVRTSPLFDITPWKICTVVCVNGGKSNHVTNAYFQMQNSSNSAIFSSGATVVSNDDAYNKDWSRSTTASWDVTDVTGYMSFYAYQHASANSNGWASMYCQFSSITLQR